jgi:hypothetical protein
MTQPAKSTSRQRSAMRDELAAAQAGERGGEVDRGVLLRLGGADERQHLLRAEHVEVDLSRFAHALDLEDGIALEAEAALGAAEDPVEDRQLLIAGARRS